MIYFMLNKQKFIKDENIIHLVNVINIQYRPQGWQHLHERKLRAIWRLYT